MEGDTLGTKINPRDFGYAARTHGRHFARYILAGQYAVGKRILDAACGSGYGSAWLARSAESVLGLDLDDHMLDLARSTWADVSNLGFAKHDLHEPLEGDKEFDLVTSFETLEHVNDPYKCLENLATPLMDQGVAMISVPNGPKELQSNNPEPSHVNHFSADELTDLIKSRFREVEFFGQVMHKGVGHYLRKFAGLGKHHAHDYRFIPGLADQAKTWLAVCRNPIR